MAESLLFYSTDKVLVSSRPSKRMGSSTTESEQSAQLCAWSSFCYSRDRENLFFLFRFVRAACCASSVPECTSLPEGSLKETAAGRAVASVCITWLRTRTCPPQGISASTRMAGVLHSDCRVRPLYSRNLVDPRAMTRHPTPPTFRIIEELALFVERGEARSWIVVRDLVGSFLW